MININYTLISQNITEILISAFQFTTLVSVLEVLIVIVPMLLTIAYVTVAERKTMASMQRRLGPNKIGYWGLLMEFADALKLILKEYVAPTQANIILFFLGPAKSCGKWLVWDKLSNSGDTLKLMVPSYSWKIISGPINHWCRVISHKMIEKEMGYRGSKSVTGLAKSVIVKEQRVDGSWHVCLRYTLMGFERNYQVKILSNQINKRLFTSIATCQLLDDPVMNPWFITGFVDAEGSFLINIYRNKELSTGWGVLPIFKITLLRKLQRDKALLEQIKSYFCVGSFNKSGARTIQYRVESVKDLATIIDHFDKYPLITQKQADYLLFKMIVNLINNKEHLTIEGLHKGI